MYASRANTFDARSRKWCARASAVTFVFLAIMSVALSIIAKYYNMAVDMDALAEQKTMKPIAIFDSCKNIHFNIKKVNNTAFEVLWHESDNAMYVYGAEEWHVQKNTVFFDDGDRPCVALVVWSVPY